MEDNEDNKEELATLFEDLFKNGLSLHIDFAKWYIAKTSRDGSVGGAGFSNRYFRIYGYDAYWEQNMLLMSIGEEKLRKLIKEWLSEKE